MKRNVVSRVERTRRHAVLFALAAILLASCEPSGTATRTGAFPASGRVCVFVPGMAKGSPIYEQLVSGTTRAVKERNGWDLDVIEGGFDQSRWKDQLADIAASGKYALVVTSNPAMPDLLEPIAKEYPGVRFFVADGRKSGLANMHTVLYNQTEQGYLAGYLAGLVTEVKGVYKGAPKAAIVVAQRYSTFDNYILPGFEAGLSAALPGATVEVKVVGSWSDAKRAQELAEALFDAGVRVILPVAGGAGQGVMSAAKARGWYVVYIDGRDGYGKAPGTVVGCVYLDQDRLVYERVKAILSGDTGLFGTADVVGASGAYVGFDPDGEAFKSLPEELKEAMMMEAAAVAAGKDELAIPSE